VINEDNQTLKETLEHDYKEESVVRVFRARLTEKVLNDSSAQMERYL